MDRRTREGRRLSFARLRFLQFLSFSPARRWPFRGAALWLEQLGGLGAAW